METSALVCNLTSGNPPLLTFLVSVLGTFTKVTDVKGSKECVVQCCLNEDCNVVLMQDQDCFHVACVSNELCTPVLSLNSETTNHVSMVLVRPVPGEETWGEVLGQGTNDI